MKTARGKRQQIRQALLIFAFLLFPISLNYFSPYLVFEGAAQRTVNGSAIVFAVLFLLSLFIGRLWCGWACPAGGLGEVCFVVNRKPVNRRKLDWIKWMVWTPWLVLFAWAVVSSGGYQAVDFTLGTENGISVAGSTNRPIFIAYTIYYMVILLFGLLAILVGRRAGCHSVCWMAPFMILGRKVRNLFAWPSLRLKAAPSLCKDCRICTANCPMSLEVNRMVQEGTMEHSECILCGTCVDVCPQKAIQYSFSAGK